MFEIPLKFHWNFFQKFLPMMVYSSLQAEFMVTKYDGHIHRYGALVNHIVYIDINVAVVSQLLSQYQWSNPLRHW